MPDKGIDELARQLWAVGDAARIRILNLLPVSAECEHGNNVSQLAAKLNMSQPTVSHHLRVLRQAGLVESRKMCRGVFYWIRTDEATEVIHAMQKLLYKHDGLREVMTATEHNDHE